MLFFLLFGILISRASAVTCTTCYDQCPGCTGGADCPFLTRTKANGLLLAGMASTATAVSMLSLLPLKFLRVLSRSVLDCMLTVSRRPAAGTPVDLGALTPEAVLEKVRTGAVTFADALSELGGRIAAATTQTEISRLNALQTTISTMDRLGLRFGEAGVSGHNGLMLGAYTFVYAQSGRVSRSDHTTVAAAGLAASSEADGEDTNKVLTAKIVRPKSMEEFSDFLLIWLMICQAAGLGNLLTLGAFVRDVVYDTMSVHKRTWMIAHELFLVYLELVETTTDVSITIANVYAKGAQDTLMQQALLNAERHFGTGGPSQSIFRGRGPGGGDELKWNGAFNKDAARCCLAFNLGRDHTAKQLTDKGKCQFNHVCDAWVTGKGKNGQCGGRHPRVKCDNPNRCDEAVQ